MSEIVVFNEVFPEHLTQEQRQAHTHYINLPPKDSSKFYGLKPLPDETIDEIEAIINDAEVGKFPYSQRKFFCGTMRCIAGEKILRDMLKVKACGTLTYEIPYLRQIEIYLDERGYRRGLVDCMDYCQNAWKLTDHESVGLMNSMTSISWMRYMISKWRRGFRYYNYIWDLV